MPAGIYIHIPFCLRKCPYCDFYSLPYDDALASLYTDALLRAIQTQPYGQFSADTLYFGGGTPVLLGAERLARMIDACRGAFSLPAHAEITIEANPAAVPDDAWAGFRAAGCNRISFGVQSLQDSELSALGRLHSANQAEQAIRAAYAAGFTAVSADLMLAIPGQSQQSLADTISRLAALPLNHISAYLLKIEDGTPFAQNKSALSLPDEDAAADLYLSAVSRLAEHGFAQYEISNFARPGGESQHNLKYWRLEPYLGLGPAAHSFLHGQRFFFPRDLDAFLTAAQPFSLVQQDGPGGGREEQLMLNLRLAEGYTAPADTDGDRLLRRALPLQAHGLLRIRERAIALTPTGCLLSNSMIAALLDEG